jgi:MarR family transcriptional regulator, negative regulator of the multidrug operon emrRAB
MTVSYICDMLMQMDRSANLLGALGLSLHDHMSRVMEEASGLRTVDAATLNSILQTPGSSISTIASMLDLTHGGAVRVVDRLEGDGIVERRSGVDGRTIGVHLTARGRSLGKRQLMARAQFLEGLIAQLNPALRRSLETTLEMLLAASTRDGAQAEHTCRLCDEHSCPQSHCPVTLAVE